MVGVLEVDCIEPSHDKQDFERTGPMCRLEDKLKRLQIAYWKANGRRVGYQAADPLPEVKRGGQAAPEADGDRGDDELWRDADKERNASALFAEREGRRKRQLPVRMNDFRIYHRQAPPEPEHEAACTQSPSSFF